MYMESIKTVAYFLIGMFLILVVSTFIVAGPAQIFESYYPDDNELIKFTSLALWEEEGKEIYDVESISEGFNWKSRTPKSLDSNPSRSLVEVTFRLTQDFFTAGEGESFVQQVKQGAGPYKLVYEKGYKYKIRFALVITRTTGQGGGPARPYEFQRGGYDELWEDEVIPVDPFLNDKNILVPRRYIEAAIDQKYITSEDVKGL